MLVLFPSIILAITALVLIILYRFRPGFRYAWLIAVTGAALAWIVLLISHTVIPISFTLFTWRPAELFPSPISFIADQHAWIYSLCLAGLAIAVLLTTAVHEYFPNSLWWAGMLWVTGIGILAVSAANPLTLILIWTLIDFIEFGIFTQSSSGSLPNRKIVIAFLVRTAGTLSLLWAGIASLSQGIRLDFSSLTGQAAVFWVIAVGLRLCSFFFQLPVAADSAVQNGFSSTLRLVSAASGLILLARLPMDVSSSPVAPLLLILAALVALYCGWKWFRSSDGLAGTSYWILGLSALAGSAAMRGNPFGATAWGSMMILSGGALFLNSVRNNWTDRALLINCWGLGTLPFSLGAVVWLSTIWFQITLPLLIISQALLVAGYIIKTMNPAGKTSDQALPAWTRMLYPAGLGFLICLQIILGIWGWEGAMQFGLIPAGLAAGILAIGITVTASRLQRFNLIPVVWIKTMSAWYKGFAQGFSGLYRFLDRLNLTVTEVLEGDGGVMWTLLFLVLFVSLMAQGRP